MSTFECSIERVFVVVHGGKFFYKFVEKYILFFQYILDIVFVESICMVLYFLKYMGIANYINMYISYYL